MIPALIRISAILIILILDCCKRTDNELIFWTSSDNKTIVDINHNNSKCIFYYSGVPNSSIYEIQKTDQCINKLRCLNAWCAYNDRVSDVKIKRRSKEIEVIYPTHKTIFYPYFNNIKWDSVRISTGNIADPTYHSTLLNDSMDILNKSLVAWMIHQDSFDFPRVADKQGVQSAIFLKLYNKGIIIAEKRANSLFIDMHWENAIVF